MKKMNEWNGNCFCCENRTMNFIIRIPQFLSSILQDKEEQMEAYRQPVTQTLIELMIKNGGGHFDWNEDRCRERATLFR
jgi:hypothetical protein